MTTAHSIFPASWIAAAMTLASGMIHFSAEAEDSPVGLPDEIVSEDFGMLRAGSPFQRSLSLSESLILTGAVQIEDELFVVLLNNESGETDLITASANAKGWKLVGIDGNPSELSEMTARVATAGGEIFAVRFDERQFEPEKGGLNPGGPRGGKPEEKAPVPERDYREGVTGDGFRGPTPPDLVRKLSQLEENTRNRLIYEIRVIRDRGVSSEERQQVFRNMVDRAVQQQR